MNGILNIEIQQILAFIADEGINVSPLSPFHALAPLGKCSGINEKAKPLVLAVCDPSASVAARILSTDGIVVTRVYSDKPGKLLVRHWTGKDGKHNFRQVQEREIADEAALRLMLDVPPSKLEFNVELSEAGFIGLLGAADCWRERVLQSLMDRKPKATKPYTYEEAYAAYQRSISSGDLRWLTSVVKAFYPNNCDITPAAFAKGITETGATLIEATPADFVVTSLGEAIFSSLSSPISAVNMSVAGLKNGAVLTRTLLGLRGMGMFCTIEPPDAEGMKVKIQNSSAPLIELFLHTRIADAKRMTKDSEVLKRAAEKTQPAPPPIPSQDSGGGNSKKLCHMCGKTLKPDAKFCAECGHRIISV